MPYIKQPDRTALNPHIDKLAEEMSKLIHEDVDMTGLLNYSFTRLGLAVVKARFGKFRYWMFASIRGALYDAAAELYRRLAAPHEDKQIQKNGDVDLYEEFLKDM
ncbi:MAG: hypothetical protein COU47_04085 [Candidatus Niyogibacteria bacterium CG10_big_fil_rev_8_21_14_0_10_46_36]|uniref:Uncharacterized protein n=1 Tax=Candidatus Niyogibacteria bacterium CG10_big_fil_rev_8_21_14_0_10_46_36 TaxID=1974726 RepID=A0A2H0TCG6_9BACT|nr:MAG: hypothetical protein COU47_04085 [Candidatus Niyogibacteria bacterium CG10_big_fil_rev_8_21_14_0_10_46_36]